MLRKLDECKNEYKNDKKLYSLRDMESRYDIFPELKIFAPLVRWDCTNIESYDTTMADESRLTLDRPIEL